MRGPVIVTGGDRLVQETLAEFGSIGFYCGWVEVPPLA